MSLTGWSWLFLVLYIALMLGLGVVAQRRIKHADDFATARNSYGPVFLAFAFAASTASGATFLGSPALSYEWGYAANWGNFLYPMGLYFGVLICMRLVASSGHKMSLILFFYLAGQLVSGLVMFEVMLGLSPSWALLITTVVLLIYVVMGGAHADILTDGFQGFMMLLLAVVVIVLFFMGYGVDGGFSGMLDNLEAQDKALVGALNENTPLYHSWWAIAAIIFAHVPLGLLPHLGNKLWALKDTNGQKQFVKLAFLFGLTLAMLGLGGLLARAVLGDALYAEGSNPNESLPLLFIELFPTWLAALIGVGVLAAVMSTADGLVVSSSQVIANDLYRRTIAPKFHPELAEDVLDRRVLLISRVATVVVLLVCMGMAWALIDKNVALIVWIGNGGMMAAFAGPLVVGALWRGVTAKGAYAGLVAGFVAFLILHTNLLEAHWFGSSGVLHNAVAWLEREGPNPYSCAAMGEFVSIGVTYVVSKLTRPLEDSHLQALFPDTAH